ncbi:glycine-rich cell wall structural protein 1-like [Ricinus communis]|uniref:glycine-rich cell wall structural protein 1-like n=1 Tax=Ricinus communis TaxID=3988 RepID=UPI00201ADE57|nr:glycine-rich cell wall structural protein 1-like [Ricinus communis]
MVSLLNCFAVCFLVLVSLSVSLSHRVLLDTTSDDSFSDIGSAEIPLIPLPPRGSSNDGSSHVGIGVELGDPGARYAPIGSGDTGSGRGGWMGDWVPIGGGGTLDGAGNGENFVGVNPIGSGDTDSGRGGWGPITGGGGTLDGAGNGENVFVGVKPIGSGNFDDEGGQIRTSPSSGEGGGGDIIGTVASSGGWDRGVDGLGVEYMPIGSGNFGGGEGQIGTAPGYVPSGNVRSTGRRAAQVGSASARWSTPIPKYGGGQTMGG